MTLMGEDGARSRTFGESPSGLLVYSPEGFMSAQIMRAGRVPFAEADRLRGSDPEVRAAFEGYIAYAGTFDVDELSGVVVHRVTISLLPNWIGTEQVRRYELSGDALTLRPLPYRIAGKTRTAELTWQRVRQEAGS
jgi:hypothetical protein